MEKSGKRKRNITEQNSQERTEMQEIHKRLVEIFREALEDSEAGNTKQINAISRLAMALKQSGIFPLKNETNQHIKINRTEIIDEINKILCGDTTEE